MPATSVPRATRASDRGFTLVEMLIALGITTLILSATIAALGDAIRATDAATLITGVNDSLRNGMDLMVRDVLQGGQGLPSGHVIQIPSGAGAAAIRIPGPPATAFTYAGTSFCPPPTALCAQVTAIIPGPGRGPAIDGGPATDTITLLAADGGFDSVGIEAFAADGSSITVDHLVNIADGLGGNDLHPGDLLMLTKGSGSALAQVSSVNGQQVFFNAGDSLQINQAGPPQGTIAVLRNTAPVDVAPPVILPIPVLLFTTVTRIRMISYYLDPTDPVHPGLIRRINNGDDPAVAAVTFDNTQGTAVAFDIENLQITYDIADGLTNRPNVRMTAVDLQGGGACGAAACSPNQIRKVNILLAARSRLAAHGTPQFFRNHLSTQVSLRSLAFADRY